MTRNVTLRIVGEIIFEETQEVMNLPGRNLKKDLKKSDFPTVPPHLLDGLHGRCILSSLLLSVMTFKTGLPVG